MMTNIIDPMQVYWVLKLDDIHIMLNFLVGGAFLSIIGCTIHFFEQNDLGRKLSKIWIVLPVFCFFLSLLINTFLPNTKQMATILVLPKIANSQFASETVNLSTDIVKLARKQVAELTKGKK